MSLLVKWNTPPNRSGTRRSTQNLHVSRTERPSGQRPVPVNIGVYAGAVRDHQALMFRKVLFAFCVLATLCVAALIAARVVIAHASKGKTYSNISLIPHRRVGLILGCPKRTFGGWTNPYFENRIAAAAELYYQEDRLFRCERRQPRPKLR